MSRDPLTEVLTTEHRLIHRAVLLFARHAARVRATGIFDAALARQFLRFFREFGERHRIREEVHLFPWMARHGIQDRGGPLGILRAEHAESRELLDAVSAITDALAARPTDREARDCFCAFSERYARLMSEHEWKENHLVYPLADYLDARHHQLVAERCTGFQSCREDPHEFERWVGDVEALAVDWPLEEVDLHPEPQALGMDVVPHVGSGSP